MSSSSGSTAGATRAGERCTGHGKFGTLSRRKKIAGDWNFSSRQQQKKGSLLNRKQSVQHHPELESERRRCFLIVLPLVPTGVRLIDFFPSQDSISGLRVVHAHFASLFSIFALSSFSSFSLPSPRRETFFLLSAGTKKNPQLACLCAPSVRNRLT